MSYRSGSPASGPAGGLYFVDPLATPLPTGLGPPAPGQPFPPGSGNAPTPVTPPVKPPVAKSWALGLEDNVGRLYAGTFQPPIDLSKLPAPTKGCIILGLADDANPAQLSIMAWVFDGTDWFDCSGGNYLATQDTGSGDSPTVRAFFNGPNAKVDAYSSPLYAEELVTFADATGLHHLVNNDAATQQQFDVPLPAGVTAADMPASKAFE